MRLLDVVLPFCLSAVAACAQTAAQAPAEFEVASVKPSAGLNDSVNVGVHVDGAQVHISDFSLQDYIRVAYRVKNYQVTGPDWLSDRFNVDAKLPAGASRDQVPEMLQALLASRFEMKFHRASKDFPVYALTVAPGGAKLKESPLEKDDDGAVGLVRGGATDVSASGGRGGVTVNFGKGSFFTFADNKLEGTKISMTNFTDLLARFMDRPVVDRTDLKGNYDISIALTPEDYRAMLIQSAVSAGVKLPPEALRLLDGASNDSLYVALRGFGLKLEPAKAPLDVIVVDHILKTPVAN
jgi:uncharacterized protein (TIGR03435 family)